jgi:allantoinase
VEVCAHYLVFNNTGVPRKATWYKCAPPLRDSPNQEKLASAVLDGDVELVSSDHAPSTLGLKQIVAGDFLKAWGGFNGAYTS